MEPKYLEGCLPPHLDLGGEGAPPGSPEELVPQGSDAKQGLLGGSTLAVKVPSDGDHRVPRTVILQVNTACLVGSYPEWSPVIAACKAAFYGNVGFKVLLFHVGFICKGIANCPGLLTAGRMTRGINEYK